MLLKSIYDNYPEINVSIGVRILRSLASNVQGKVALISGEAINQLHIFIFVLAVSHVLYCICTLALGRLKVILFDKNLSICYRDMGGSIIHVKSEAYLNP